MNKTYWHPEKLDRWDWLIGGLVVLGSFWLLMATLDMGFTRDESFYFHAAYQYIGWFEELWRNFQAGHVAQSFTQANIDKHWGYNPEHPVLVKTMFALSYKLFADKLGWLSDSAAMRLPGALFGAVTVAFTYMFGRQTFGRLAGVVAAGALFFQPRFFFHAHLTCFDVPVTALWVMVIYAYWRSYESKGWAVATGVFWGLALSAKLNAFFLPPVLLLHWFLLHWRDFGLERDTSGTLRLRVPAVPWAFFSMAVLGPILFYALWPRHWFDTWNRVQWYINFHLKHVHYFVWYFGRRLDLPPFPMSFPWVMTAVTVPATILLAFVMGLGEAARKWRLVDWASRWAGVLGERRLPDTRSAEAGFDPRGTGLLLAINFVFPIALIGMPSTPIFGGTKHWMSAMPFLAIFAGAGVAMAARLALRAVVQSGEAAGDEGRSSRPVRWAVAGALSLAVLGPAVYATWYNHPFGTSYYNELIGSYRGAADAGMMRQFWGYAGRQGLPWLDEHAPDGARVWTHNTTGYAWNMYRRDGLVRKDLRPAGPDSSQFGLFHHQRAFTWELTRLWKAYGTRAPAHVVGIDGVPVLSIYERPGVEERGDKAGHKPGGKPSKKPRKKPRKQRGDAK